MNSNDKQATIHRMVLDTHVCPFGEKAVGLLKDQGYEVDDQWLTTREQVDAFKAEHNLDTTPLVFIGGQRIGGYDELREHLG